MRGHVTVHLILAAALLSAPRCARAEDESPRDYGIRPVPFTQVQLTDSFWRPRLQTNTRVTVPYCFSRCEETGRIGNFEAAAKHDPSLFHGLQYDDSDVFKILEGACYTLAVQPNAKLRAYVDDLVQKIAAAQEPDGYLYTIKTSGAKRPFGEAPRWSKLSGSHELYNVGHLYEAAVAHFQVTHERTLLDVAIRNADLVCRVFGPAADQRKDVPGHEEIEIGLVKLYRATGDEKYLRQACFFVDMRGRNDIRSTIYGPYAQDHQPIAEQQEAVGHAVRGGYYYAAVADVAALTGEKSYIAAIDRIWRDVVDKKLYLIGSVGQHGAGEGYAGAYKLSNVQAYNETCASVALMLWNHRMFLLHGDAKYIDVLERTLYNGLLAGVGMSGDRFFYPNPLECDMAFRFNHGSLERSPWFGTSCCPSNVARTIPSVPGYVYATRNDELFVNLYMSGHGQLEVGGVSVDVAQTTQYPWEGNVQLEIRPRRAAKFTVRLRIPVWAQGEVLPSGLYRSVGPRPQPWSLRVNGETVKPRVAQGYADIDREWRAGDRIELNLPMTPRRVLADSRVEPDRGLVAVERGPLVYCAEGADNDGHVRDLWLSDDAVLKSQFDDALLGGVTSITTTAGSVRRSNEGTLEVSTRPLKLIPYYAWCHRGANEMRVWLPRTMKGVRVPPPPTVASRARPSASHCWRTDTVRALNDQVEPRNSIDHDIPRFTWWDHRGTTEWVQYDLNETREVQSVAVYWFDDTGRGQCRLPKTWKVLYRDGDQWKPVRATTEYPLRKDAWNVVEFEAVSTRALRIEVELQTGFSGGLLEWKID